MKKINKKGFTLVELLAVVVILLAISVIAISSISAAIERQNVKKDEATKKILISYAKLYFDDHKNTIGAMPCVNTATLVSKYNLDAETLKANTDISGDGVVDTQDTFDNGSIRSDYSYNYSECP